MTLPATASHVLALTTVGSEDAAALLVRQLVEEGIVACGTIIPGARSVFRWEGTVTEETEVVVLFKTHRDRWADLRAAIESRHPYDVPELLALPIEAGLEPYLEWVTKVTAVDR